VWVGRLADLGAVDRRVPLADRQLDEASAWVGIVRVSEDDLARYPYGSIWPEPVLECSPITRCETGWW
jgi:hypothetical protein